MQEGASPVGAFLEEKCNRSGSVGKTELYEAWRQWCRETGNSPGSIQQFSSDVRAKCGDIKDSRLRAKDGEQRIREWTGVSLKSLWSTWVHWTGHRSRRAE